MSSPPPNSIRVTNRLACWYEATPEAIAWIEREAAKGATDLAIAGELGISTDSFRELRKYQHAVEEAVTRGRVQRALNPTNAR
jgi:hypothetical protein